MGRRTTDLRTGAALAVALAVACTGACSGRQPAQARTPPTDAAIAAAIERELARSERLDGSAIRVDVAGGVAVLSGVVSSSRQAREALRLAAVVDGVLQVVNRLVIVDPQAGTRGADLR